MPNKIFIQVKSNQYSKLDTTIASIICLPKTNYFFLSQFSFISILLSMIVLLIIFYFFFNRNETNNNDFFNISENNTQALFEKKNPYIFYLGLLIVIVEIINEQFHIRQKNELLFYLFFGIAMMATHFFIDQKNYLKNNSKPFFTSFLLLYTIYLFYKFLFYPFEHVFLFELAIAFILSFTVFKKLIWYYLYVGCIFIFLSYLFISKTIPQKETIILFNMLLIIGLINQNGYLEKVKMNHNLLFASTIVDKGNSLIIVFNASNEIIFCSETIIRILGYKPKEVIGTKFNKLTQSEAFYTSEKGNNNPSIDLIIDEIVCKDGTKKFMQWTKKKYSNDFFVCFGNDVSERIYFEKSYESLVESATDIIGEMNQYGRCTFANKNSEKIIGYSLNELYQINTFNLVRKDYRRKVISMYQKLPEDGMIYPELEFPIINKFGKTIWLSQKVSIKKNIQDEIIGYLVVARDVTELKKLMIIENKRRKKIERYNKLIVELNMTDFSGYSTFEESISKLIENIAKNTKNDLVSYWKYDTEELECLSLYNKTEVIHSSSGYKIYKKEHPNYFSEIEKEATITIPVLDKDHSMYEICQSISEKNDVKSIMKSPVFINGKLEGVLCLGTLFDYRKWDDLDINFASTTSDIFALAIKENERKIAANRMEYNNRFLSIINENTQKILVSKSIDEIVKNTIQSIGKLINLNKISYFENDESSQTIIQKFNWSKENNHFVESNKINERINYTIYPEFLELIVEKNNFKAKLSQIENPTIKQLFIKNDVKSILFFPVFVKNLFYGLISFSESEYERDWEKDEIDMIQSSINNVQLIIERNINENIIQENEDKFKLLANNIPGTVYLSYYDEKLTKNYVNDEIVNLTGYSKEAFLTNEILLIDIIHPLDKKYVETETRKCLSEGKPFHITYRVIKKSGDIIWIEDFGDAIRNENKIIYIEGILIDITLKKEAEAAIIAKELAEAATKSKTEFLANMSHEIRTPLNAIIGFTDLMLQTELDNSQNQYMNVVNESGQILMEIINNILDFSKIESGKLELEIVKSDLVKICNQIIEIVKYEALQKNISLFFTIDQSIQNIIWIDAFRLKQILINLLANAIKFTPVGKIELRIVRLDSDDHSLQKIRFSVIDSGIGIKQQSQKNIFNAFSQEDNSTTRKYGGTGLGLSISNKILQLMNSKLQVKSKLKEGSTFYFDLELKSESNENDAEKNKTNFEYLPQEIDKSSANLLIVDDNQINVLLAKTIIKKIRPNVTIKECYNGIEALEYCKNITPDLIFMDVQMPILNGYEATNEIRKLDGFENIPIIAFTAGTILGEREKCLANGMNDFVPKPVTQKAINDALNSWLKA